MLRTFALLLGVLLSFVATPAWARGGPAARPGIVAMPSVVGSSEADAVEQLRLRDLEVSVLHIVSVQVGRVVTQDPAPGSRLHAGSEVQIQVGIAADIKTVMPNVVGQTVDQARDRLERVYVLEFVEVPGPSNHVGRIIRQAPEANALHPFRGAVRLEVIQATRGIPNVVGQNVQVARRILRRDGLRSEVEEVTEPHVVNGVVLAQDPPAGSPVPKGRTRVRLRVATHDVIEDTSPNAVPCPDLRGLSFAQAHQTLLLLGLSPHGSFVRSTEQNLIVFAQTEPIGTGLSPGSHVHFSVARNAAAAMATTDLPSLLGASFEEASEIIRGLGLNGRVEKQPSALPEGTVLAMRPHAGTQVQAGTVVSLVVAQQSQWGGNLGRVRLPDVRGRGLETARRALYGLGLDVQVLIGAAPNATLDQVIDQRPAAGRRVAPGQTVRLYLPLAVLVPDLVGLGLRRAQALLSAAGLTAATEQGLGAQFARRRVTETLPPAGTRVAKGSLVELKFALVDGPGGGVIPGPPGPGVIVPNVVGLNLPGAQQVLSSMGLIPVGGKEAAAQPGRFRVSVTDPVAGTRVAPGSHVRMEFEGRGGRPGTGQSVPIPSFVGMTPAQAQARCQQLGLACKFDGPVTGGRGTAAVSRQSVIPGHIVARGTEIVLQVAWSGHVDVRAVQVPDVMGKSRVDAINLLRGAGLKASVRGMDAGWGRLRTKVRTQDPRAGSQVEAGSTVVITLGF